MIEEVITELINSKVEAMLEPVKQAIEDLSNRIDLLEEYALDKNEYGTENQRTKEQITEAIQQFEHDINYIEENKVDVNEDNIIALRQDVNGIMHRLRIIENTVSISV